MISTLRLPSFLPCASCITTLDFGWLRALVISCECTPKLKKAFGARCFSYCFTFFFSKNFLLPRHWTTDFLSLRRERKRCDLYSNLLCLIKVVEIMTTASDILYIFLHHTHPLDFHNFIFIADAKKSSIKILMTLCD